MKYDVKFIKGRIDHVQKHIDTLKEKNKELQPDFKNFHGGWNLGYWEGKLAVYEDLREEIEGNKF